MGMDSEEAQFGFTIGDQHILGLTVMVEHHFMILAAETGFFITAKRGMCRIGVVTVHPYPAGLYRSWDLVKFVSIPGRGRCSDERVRHRIIVWRLPADLFPGSSGSYCIDLRKPALPSSRCCRGGCPS